MNIKIVRYIYSAKKIHEYSMHLEHLYSFSVVHSLTTLKQGNIIIRNVSLAISSDL